MGPGHAGAELWSGAHEGARVAEEWAGGAPLYSSWEQDVSSTLGMPEVVRCLGCSARSSVPKRASFSWRSFFLRFFLSCLRFQ